MIAVEARSVVKCFGDTVALGGVSIRVEPGELFFLLGPSGCGKTTLLRCLAGFAQPDEGAIHFGEEEVTRLAPHKRNTGMMFQSYALWPHMTVAQNVAFGLEQRKVPKEEREERVQQALEAVRMGDYGSRKPNQLSGGQQQRVALARALVVRPACLLLDEPLSNLDAKLRLEMRQEIRRVCKEFSLTTIYVTHDQKEALSVADRMAVLDQGHVLQVGTPSEVYRRPANRFVADFIGESNFIPGKVRDAGGGFALVETAMGNWRGVTTGEDDPAEGSDVILCIRPECLRLDPIEPEENGCPVVLGETVYYGETAQRVVHPEAHGAAPLKVFELNPRHGSTPVGRVNQFLWAEAEDVVVLAS